MKKDKILIEWAKYFRAYQKLKTKIKELEENKNTTKIEKQVLDNIFDELFDNYYNFETLNFYISLLPEVEYKIIYDRYILKKSWLQISLKYNYSRTSCFNIRTKVLKYLEEYKNIKK